MFTVSGPEFVVCVLVSTTPIVVDGSTRVDCVRCKQPMWIAPTGRAALADFPKAKPICFGCVVIEGEMRAVRNLN